MLPYAEDMQHLLKELGKMIEFERFKMGMGKYDFAQHLGMHYHTYTSFLKQDRITKPKTGSIILTFLVGKGIDVDKLAPKMNQIKVKMLEQEEYICKKNL